MLKEGKIICHIFRHTMARNATHRKRRKTYTLSPEAISILEAERRERKALSASAVLEELLHEVRRQRQMAGMRASISNYYDSLSDEAVEEQELWGRFSETQFPLK